MKLASFTVEGRPTYGIVEGDQRAATQPGAMLMLASAYLALIMTWPVPAPLASPLAEDEA